MFSPPSDLASVSAAADSGYSRKAAQAFAGPFSTIPELLCGETEKAPAVFLQIVTQITKLLDYVRGEIRVSVASIRAKQRPHVIIVRKRNFADMVGDASQRVPIMEFESPGPTHEGAGRGNAATRFKPGAPGEHEETGQENSSEHSSPNAN